MKGSGTRLAVDGNRGWTTRDALHVSRECLDIPFLMEQPRNSVEELTQTPQQVTHPIYMAESSEGLNAVTSAAGTGLVDGFGMKITRIDGLDNTRTSRDICEARSLPHTCDDAWDRDIIAAACVHIAANMRPDRCEGVWIAAPYIEGNYDRKNSVNIEEGHISLPEGPGLGILSDTALLGDPIASFQA